MNLPSKITYPVPIICIISEWYDGKFNILILHQWSILRKTGQRRVWLRALLEDSAFVVGEGDAATMGRGQEQLERTDKTKVVFTIFCG